MHPQIQSVREQDNAAKTKTLELARRSLKVHNQKRMDKAERREAARQRLLGQNPNQCPCCKAGTMQRIGVLPPSRAPPQEGQELKNALWLV